MSSWASKESRRIPLILLFLFLFVTFRHQLRKVSKGSHQSGKTFLPYVEFKFNVAGGSSPSPTVWIKIHIRRCPLKIIWSFSRVNSLKNKKILAKSKDAKAWYHLRFTKCVAAECLYSSESASYNGTTVASYWNSARRSQMYSEIAVPAPLINRQLSVGRTYPYFFWSKRFHIYEKHYNI